MATSEKVVEKVVENIDNAVEIGTEVVKAFDPPKGWVCGLSRKQHAVQIVTLLTVGGAIGGVVAYYVCKKKLELQFEKELAEEVQKAKDFHAALYKKEGFQTPQQASETLGSDVDEVKEELPASPRFREAEQSLLNYAGVAPAEPPVTLEAETVNIFTDKKLVDTFDLETEMKQRSPLHPYIINDEEYAVNAQGHQQKVLTYYEGDTTLADDQDVQIVDVDKMVGEANLQHFGYGTGDSSLLYIRNERLNVDFEIVRSEGKYAHEVAGMGHLEHSDDPRSQRMQTRRERRDE